MHTKTRYREKGEKHTSKAHIKEINRNNCNSLGLRRVVTPDLTSHTTPHIAGKRFMSRREEDRTKRRGRKGGE
jgi:hypothetical protein